MGGMPSGFSRHGSVSVGEAHRACREECPDTEREDRRGTFPSV